jgi:serine/threonine-protein kinase RsbW
MITVVGQGGPPEVTDLVQLRVPADPAYLAVVRTASAELGVRLALTLDEIEDLRIAVDEACSMLLGNTTHGGENLYADFTIRPGRLDVQVRGPAGILPDRSSFAWTVLEALVGRVETGATDAGCWIRLSHTGGRRAT